MKTKLLIFTLLTLITLVLYKCKSDVYNPDVCFQENVLPIFVTRCSMPPCHNNTDHAAGYDFSAYDGIMKAVTANHPNQSEAYTIITGNSPQMPVGGKLSDIDITYIKIWIKMGAKNSSNCSNCDTSQFSYSGRISDIFKTWCEGCHTGSNPAGGYNFNLYTDVAQSIVDSKLLESLNHDPTFSPMPSSNSKLSSCDLKAITKWVNAGYPNN